MIVPVPSALPIVATVGLDKWSLKVSFDSRSVSPLIVMLTVLVRSPGAKVNVPEAAA